MLKLQTMVQGFIT